MNSIACHFGFYRQSADFMRKTDLVGKAEAPSSAWITAHVASAIYLERINWTCNSAGRL